MKNLKTYEQLINEKDSYLYVDENKIKKSSKSIFGDKTIAKCVDSRWAKQLFDAWNRKDSSKNSIKFFDKIFAEENIIKQKKMASDLFLQFNPYRTIAKCTNSEWAKILVNAWNSQ